MLQVIIVKHTDWNDRVFEFISRLKEKNTPAEKITDLLYKYAEVYNVLFNFDSQMLSIEEVNNCILVLRGGVHCLTIKYEL